MMQAKWNGHIIARSDDTIVVEGNHYFPREAVEDGLLEESATTSFCPWKGTASYYSVKAGGDLNRDAAWYYPEPKGEAEHIKGRVAFWKGVEISEA